jgi:methoxymalonate biosynthesis acyl carrier protein
VSTTQTVKEYIVAEYLPGTSPDELDPSYDLLDTGVVDSLRLLQLISWVERQYRIPIDDVEISPDDFRSVHAICAFIDSANSTRTSAEGERGR